MPRVPPHTHTHEHPTPSQALSTPQPQSYSQQRNGEPQQSSGPATNTIYMGTCAWGVGHVPPGATAGQARHHAHTWTRPPLPHACACSRAPRSGHRAHRTHAYLKQHSSLYPGGGHMHGIPALPLADLHHGQRQRERTGKRGVREKEGMLGVLATPRGRGHRHGMQSGHINVDFIVVAGSSKAKGVPVGCMPAVTTWPTWHLLLGWPPAWLRVPHASRDPPLRHHPCSPGDAHVTQPQTLSTCCTQQRVHDGRGAGGCRHRTLVRWGNGGPPTHAHTDHTRTHGPQRWPGYSPPPQ